MLNSTSTILSLRLVMISAVEPVQTVHGVVMTHAEMVALAAADADARNQTKLENGSGFVKALGAPFRAIGRLFGGGKKKKNRVERITQKDIEKFEAAKPVQTTQTQGQTQAEAAKGMLVTSPSSLVTQTDKTRII